MIREIPRVMDADIEVLSRLDFIFHIVKFFCQSFKNFVGAECTLQGAKIQYYAPPYVERIEHHFHSFRGWKSWI